MIDFINRQETSTPLFNEPHAIGLVGKFVVFDPHKIRLNLLL